MVRVNSEQALRAITLVLLMLAPGALAQPTTTTATTTAASDEPIAFFTLTPDIVSSGRFVKADASESVGGLGENITEYAWRWNESADHIPGNVTEEHSFPQGGVHVVGLRVTDAAGAVAFANRSVLVKGAAPSAYFTLTVTPRDGGLAVETDATFSEPSRGASRIVLYEWDWGDGSGFVAGNVTASHFFDKPGEYSVKLRVTDDEDRADVTTERILVRSTFLTRLGEVWDEREAFLRGARLTILLAVIATVLGFVLAIALALMRVSHTRLLRWPAAIYVEFIRGTPLLVQILVAWLVLPFFGLKLPILWAGALALTVNTSAYQAEAIRGGIQGIPTGQMEAATSLGMTNLQAMRHIILPQALRLTLPPLGNEFVILLKDTSLVSVIGVVELTQIGRIFSAQTFLVLETWLGVAVIYFVMTYAMTLVLRHLEKRLRIPGLGVGGTPS